MISFPTHSSSRFVLLVRVSCAVGAGRRGGRRDGGRSEGRDRSDHLPQAAAFRPGRRRRRDTAAADRRGGTDGVLPVQRDAARRQTGRVGVAARRRALNHRRGRLIVERNQRPAEPPRSDKQLTQPSLTNRATHLCNMQWRV